MHLPAKMAIWRKASDPGDPAGDVRGVWGAVVVGGGSGTVGGVAFNRIHPDHQCPIH